MTIRESTTDVEVWLRDHGAAAVQLIADKAAKAAVSETFYLLGVDVGDQESVSSFRDGMRHVMESVEARKDRNITFSRGIIQGALTVLTSGLVSLGAWAFAMFHH